MNLKSVISGKSDSSAWNQVKFHVFDVPERHELSFSQRLQMIDHITESIKSPFMSAVKYFICDGEDHLLRLAASRMNQHLESGAFILRQAVAFTPMRVKVNDKSLCT